MNHKAIKITIVVVVLATLIGIGVGLYFHYGQGPTVGSVQFGTKYHLRTVNPSSRFPGVTEPDETSYFRINNDKQTGELYLKGLTTSSSPIPFTVTNYKEDRKQTTIDFEYLFNQGKETRVQHLTAISKDDVITISSTEPSTVYVIHGDQTSNDPQTIEFEAVLFVFDLQEAAE